MNKMDLVYTNNNILGYISDNVYQSYKSEEKNELLNNFKKEVINKDKARKLSSLIIGLTLFACLLTLAVLMILNVVNLGDSQWFNFTFILALLVVVWIILYYLVGLIFYRKITINFHFKSSKLNNPNSCVMYASSNYAKYFDKYSKYLKNTSFYADETKKKLVLFGMKKPVGYSSFIFNGSISTNIPYFYLTINNLKFLFLPGLVVIVNKDKSDVIPSCNFKTIYKEKTYHLYKNDTLIASFYSESEFDLNFFNFKYEQIA